MQKQLTAYQLACGYVQEKSNNIAKVQLYKEHHCYHVRSFNPDSQWLTFDTVKEARKAFKNQCKMVGIL